MDIGVDSTVVCAASSLWRSEIPAHDSLTCSGYPRHEVLFYEHAETEVHDRDALSRDDHDVAGLQISMADLRDLMSVSDSLQHFPD